MSGWTRVPGRQLLVQPDVRKQTRGPSVGVATNTADRRKILKILGWVAARIRRPRSPPTRRRSAATSRGEASLLAVGLRRMPQDAVFPRYVVRGVGGQRGAG